MATRKEISAAVGQRYRHASRDEKGRILDEFVALTHYHRKRAKAAGYSAIVFTIDAFAPGTSDDTVRLGFSFPPSLPLVNSKTGVFKSSLGWNDVLFR